MYEHSSTRHFQWCVVAAILALAIAGCGPSHVRVSNQDLTVLNRQNGVLVTDGFSPRMERRYGSITDLINVSSKAGDGEVAAFSDHRPMELVPVSWPKTSNNPASVKFANEFFLPVTVWIVQGPFNTQRLKALNDLEVTRYIWAHQRIGLVWRQIVINDATANTNASKYLAFACGQRANMQSEIGQTAGQINIYYVNTVDIGSSIATTNGNACEIGGGFVAMGSASGSELLLHETGHNFALTHTDGMTSFDTTGALWSASNDRGYFTEGETYRAHLAPASAINAVYGMRPGKTTRNCSATDFNRTCPELRKRVWPDGAFPAN